MPAVALRAAAAAALAVGAAGQPEQVRLAIGATPDTMSVQWVDQNSSTPAVVRWGRSASELTSSAKSEVCPFTQDPGRLWYNHVAKMGGLHTFMGWSGPILARGNGVPPVLWPGQPPDGVTHSIGAGKHTGLRPGTLFGTPTVARYQIVT